MLACFQPIAYSIFIRALFAENTSLHLYITELTLAREDAVVEAYKHKKLRSAELAADVQQRGWTANVRPIEVGRRRFIATSTSKLLEEMEVRGMVHRQAKTSQGPLMKRKDCGSCGSGVKAPVHQSEVRRNDSLLLQSTC